MLYRQGLVSKSGTGFRLRQQISRLLGQIQQVIYMHEGIWRGEPLGRKWIMHVVVNSKKRESQQTKNELISFQRSQHAGIVSARFQQA